MGDAVKPIAFRSQKANRTGKERYRTARASHCGVMRRSSANCAGTEFLAAELDRVLGEASSTSVVDLTERWLERIDALKSAGMAPTAAHGKQPWKRWTICNGLLTTRPMPDKGNYFT